MEMLATQMPEVGQAAPPVSLPDDAGTPRDLAERRGHWTVLYFYPKDDTPGCTTEAGEFRDINSDMTAHDAEVWGVSVLGSGSKAAFKRKFGLNFVLLADVNHAVAERYGAWVEKINYGRSYMGIQRATFLVDPDGKIAHVWPKVKAQGHAADVLATLDAARAARTGKKPAK
ncbi:MAG: peroxiredoxin [Chloroflexota bacterium]|nr:peroxiredoxin [Chloroflexota bacterium]